MRILIVGGGGREHALAWKISRSPLVTKLYCAPGNAGIAQVAECVDIPQGDLQGLAQFAEANRIDLTVVGPEGPLIAGLVDVFEAAGLPVFGPSRDPAMIEGSKVFAKALMQNSGIPTAGFWTCSSRDEARACVRDYYRGASPETKIVVKADGIAAGKGVVVAGGEAEAYAAIDRMMQERVFGSSGDKVVVEECLEGDEASIMALTDGSTIVSLLPSQDHKRALDGDTGPNTGGMGAYCPVPAVPQETLEFAAEHIVRPAVLAIRELGIPYRGTLYAGIIITADGPKCIEFNCRFGDPETQAVLPMMESDLVPLLMGVVDGTLDQAEVSWLQGGAVCVVAASEGYPGAFDPGCDVRGLVGRPIAGLEAAAAAEGCLVFHSGTAMREDAVVTSGGRVLSVTGLGDDLLTATGRAYLCMDNIRFEGMHYRRDIAARALG